MACDILPVAMFFLTCSCCRLGYIWNILEYLEYILGPKSYFQTLEITPLWQRGSFSYLLLLLLVGIYWNIWNILEYIWGPKNYLWGGNFSYLLLLLLLLLLRPVKKSYRWSLKMKFFPPPAAAVAVAVGWNRGQCTGTASPTTAPNLLRRGQPLIGDHHVVEQEWIISRGQPLQMIIMLRSWIYNLNTFS